MLPLDTLCSTGTHKGTLKEHYGITMPIRTVGEYLRRWGFTVQRPMKQAMNRKPEQVQEW